MNIRKYILPSIYGITYSSVGFPSLSGYRPDIGTFSFIIVLVSAFLLILGTKILFSRRNYFALMIIALLICGYSLKLAYLEILTATRLSSISSDVILKTLFDTFKVGYLEYNAEIYSFYLLSYIICLFSVVIAALFLPTVDYSQLSTLVRSNRSITRDESILFLLFFSISSVFGLLLLNSISFGISSGDATNIDRLPFKLDTLIYMFLRYGLTLVGIAKYFQVNSNNRHNNYPLSNITKTIILTYLLAFSLYSTSKEYLFIALFMVLAEMYRAHDYKFMANGKISVRKLTILTVKLFLLFTISISVLSVNTAARFIRNSNICPNCSGIQASKYALSAVFDGSVEKIQESLGNSESLKIPIADKLALSTIFRIQGADNTLQIITKNHTSDNSPDLMGPALVFTGNREPGHEFYFYKILPYRRIGINLAVAFPPSLIGLSYQNSFNLINPAVFGIATYAFYVLLISTLISTRAKIPIAISLLMTYEALKSFSEGSFSNQLLTMGIIIAVFYKIVAINKHISRHA